MCGMAAAVPIATAAVPSHGEVYPSTKHEPVNRHHFLKLTYREAIVLGLETKAILVCADALLLLKYL